jgi:hypothetical protein
MKTRTRDRCVGGIAAIACLAILSAALASTGGVSPRDLAPDELWLIRGGTPRPNPSTCCSLFPQCNQPLTNLQQVNCASRAVSVCTSTNYAIRYTNPSGSWQYCDQNANFQNPPGGCNDSVGTPTMSVCLDMYTCVVGFIGSTPVCQIQPGSLASVFGPTRCAHNTPPCP